MQIKRVKLSERQPSTSRKIDVEPDPSKLELDFDRLADRVAGTKAQMEYINIRSGKALLIAATSLVVSGCSLAVSILVAVGVL